MKRVLYSITLGLAMFAAALVPASASLSVVSTPMAPTGLTFLNINSATLGPGVFVGPGYTVTAVTNSLQGFVKGTLGGVHAAPVTGPNVGGVVQTYKGTYVSTGLTQGATGKVTFHFTSPVTEFGLLWGSIDPSNLLSFYNGTTSVGSVLGASVGTPANGFQGYGGSKYVEVTSTTPFNNVVLTSGQISFEGAEFEANTSTPEPGVYGMMLAGFAILGTVFVIKRRKNSSDIA